MPVRIDIKRGDTYSRDFQLFSDYAQNITFNLTGYTIRSQIRSPSGSLISTCTCTITNAAAGAFSVVANSVATAAWLIGEMMTDIELTSQTGHVISTETFVINVLEDQTI